METENGLTGTEYYIWNVVMAIVVMLSVSIV